jgi:hypothetical protein
MAQAPADGETVTIGSQVFEFDNATPPVAGGGAARIAVYIGANLAAAVANLVKAINGTVDAAVWTPGNGSTSVPAVVADAYGGAGGVRIKGATARGGTATPAAPASTALATNVGGGSAWDMTNLNASAGRAAVDGPSTVAGKITITAAMITKGSVEIELPFACTILEAEVRSSTGVLRASDEAVTLENSGTTIKQVLAGGASPNLQANDVLTFVAYK